ncbi:hypothetical protein AAC387_Pa06g1318 [Persea americana]
MLRTKPCMQRLHHLLRDSHSHPSSHILSILDSTTNIRKLRQIHAHMILTGIFNDPFAASRLLASPALVEFTYTHSIFLQIPHPNLFICNTIIKKLVDSCHDGLTCHPLTVYQHMLEIGLRPNGHTFMYLIRALAARLEIRQGEEIHTWVLKLGFGYSQFVSSALVGFYVVLGHLESARRVFDEMPEPGMVLWTAMIRAYVCGNCPKEALGIFREMRVKGLDIDSVGVATVVSACGQLGDLSVARKVHGFISKSGIEVDEFVNSGLLSMYGDCGSLDLARRLFDEMPGKNVFAWNAIIHQCAKHGRLDLAYQLFKEMPGRDVVSWNTMITGFYRAGRCKDALSLFHEMESSSDVKPNNLTLSSVLSACASLGALDLGTWIHVYIEKNNLNLEGSLDPSLIDMYSKCGSIGNALQVFEKTPWRDIFSWTSIICGLAMHGLAKDALCFFTQMLIAGIKPDDVTLVGVLTACAHAGLLDEGRRYFDAMEKVYKITPKIEHFGCMIDLLGRMGHLREANDLIMEMPMRPNVVIWGALLSACRVHNDVELGEVATERLLELDPYDLWVRVMQSNMYAEARKWDGVMRLRKEMKDMGMRKSPGCSLIEVNGMVHEFLVGDDSHPQHIEIRFMLENIETQLKGV